MIVFAMAGLWISMVVMGGALSWLRVELSKPMT